jgi:propanol-preferring alcohol dehydrogenase
MKAVELAKAGTVRSKMSLRWSRDLSKGYETVERGDIAGRVVLRIDNDPGTMIGDESTLCIIL